MNEETQLLQNLDTELKRGSIILVVLSQLFEKEYGYSLIQKLETLNYPIEANTLYPLLRRLEKQKLLISEWDTGESRPRKFYKISSYGIDVYESMLISWTEHTQQIKKILGEVK